MKLYKIYSRAIGLLFALSLLCVGCENEDILDINDLEISPSNPESVVIVEPDDGITSVNALTKAINEMEMQHIYCVVMGFTIWKARMSSNIML